jgi:hypothetical protein
MRRRRWVKDGRIKRKTLSCTQIVRSTVILINNADPKKKAKLAQKLSETEEDALSHLARGYQLEVTVVKVPQCYAG